jgi:hypothetical protein
MSRRGSVVVALVGTSLAVLLVLMLARVWAVPLPWPAAVEPSASHDPSTAPVADADLAVSASASSAANPALSPAVDSAAGSAEGEAFVRSSLATAVADAYAAGAPHVSRLAVAVVDLRSGRLHSAGDIDAEFPSASLIKVFIAARLLVEGRAEDPAVRDAMWRMIVCSDDDAATWLYGLVGGDSLPAWVTSYYGIGGVAPPSLPGWWGLSQVTARAMVTFYAHIAADPTVGAWLRAAMGATQPYGCDGFPQYFGLAAATAPWQVKQGWMCCHFGRSQMHSTGFVDDRYAVALLSEGPPSTYGEPGAVALTVVAQTLLPSAFLTS